MNTKEFFARPQVKAAFDNYNIQEQIRLVKIICWVAAIAMPSGAFLDLIDYPNYIHQFLKIRLISSFSSLILLGLINPLWGKRHHLLLSLLSAAGAQAFICWMIYASDGGSSPYYAILNLPLFIYCLLFPWTYLMTFGLSIATVAFYLIACFLHGGMTDHYPPGVKSALQHMEEAKRIMDENRERQERLFRNFPGQAWPKSHR